MKDVTGGIYDLAVPVITPSTDGFYCAYASFHYIRPLWMHVTGVGSTAAWTKVPLHAISGHGIATSQLRFPTIATINEAFPAERLHIAWEEDYINGNSAIFYQPFDRGLTAATFIPGNIVEVSKGLPLCVHRHPNVAVESPTALGHGLAKVTWETTELGPAFDHKDKGSGISSNSRIITWGTKVVVRDEMTPGSWGSFISVYPKLNNLPLPLLRVGNILNAPGPTPYYLKEVVYQDTLLQQSPISRLSPPGTIANWNTTRLEEYAQYPNVSLPWTQEPIADAGTLTFRGIYADESHLYAAKIVATPPAEAPVPLLLSQIATIAPSTHSCVQTIVSANGPGIMSYTQADTAVQVNVDWQYRPVGLFAQTSIETQSVLDTMDGENSTYIDTTSLLAPTGWTSFEDSVRTNYFSIVPNSTFDMNRLFEVQDTAWLNSVLVDTSRFVSYQLLLKDSASGLVTQILDAATVRGQVNANTPGIDINDTTVLGIGHHIHVPLIPTVSGKAYVTIRLLKDNATTLGIAQEQRYGGDLVLPVPDDSALSFKKVPSPFRTLSMGSSGLSIRPNPAKETAEINAEVLSDVPTTVTILDVLGKQLGVLYEGTPTNGQLHLSYDVHSLPSGSYVVRVAFGNEVHSGKMEVLR